MKDSLLLIECRRDYECCFMYLIEYIWLRRDNMKKLKNRFQSISEKEI